MTGSFGDLQRGWLSLPTRVVVGANGAYWRDFGTFYSMCPQSSDNDVVERVAVYELVETQVWLIERGQPEKQSPTVWWTGREEIGWGGWSPRAWEALPYRTKEQADEIIRAAFTRPGSEPTAHAVQHGFDHGWRNADRSEPGPGERP